MPRTSDLRDPTPDPDTGLTAAQRSAALMKLGAFGLEASEMDAFARAAIKGAKAGVFESTSDGIDWLCDRLQQGWSAAEAPALLEMRPEDRERALAYARSLRTRGEKPTLRGALKILAPKVARPVKKERGE